MSHHMPDACLIHYHLHAGSGALSVIPTMPDLSCKNDNLQQVVWLRQLKEAATPAPLLKDKLCQPFVR